MLDQFSLSVTCRNIADQAGNKSVEDGDCLKESSRDIYSHSFIYLPILSFFILIF